MRVRRSLALAQRSAPPPPPELPEDFIEHVFGAGGLLAQRFAGYEPREGQLALARAVDAAFSRGENLLAEAPTGTGKSLAYAVPAIWHARRHGKRVVIATANIALQEQLVGKDLPLLAEVLGDLLPFRYALAKGRSNYLCLDQFGDARAEYVLTQLANPDERRQWDAIVEWAELVTERGDLSELPFEPLPSLRPRFTVSADECLGKACGSYQECHANRAYRELPESDVVVTNYHLLFAHLAVARATGGEAGLLPPFDLLVLDEGHKAADIARDFFGFRVTGGGLRHLGKLLAAGGKASKKGPLEDIDPALKLRYDAASDRFATSLRAIRRSPDYLARLREPQPEGAWTELCEVLGEVEAAYLHAAASRPLTQARKLELQKCALRCCAVSACVTEAMTVAKPDEAVYFLEEDGQRVALIGKPVNVAPVLAEQLFQPPPGSAGPSSVAVLSATLRGGSTFRFVAGELGVDGAGAEGMRHHEELVAPSPFDFHAQAVLVLPAGLPEPTDRRFPQHVARVLCEAVERAHGRTLGLFTSYANLEVAHAEVARAFRGTYLVMRQGEAPRTQLIRRFREDVSSVLLGTESFWQGVDVPGEALSCLVMDKLPFAPPDDPILDAVQERDPKGWFRNYSMPRALLAFRQGFGRLIRSTSDRGVFVCCDRRLADKGYGKVFVRALPEMQLARDLSAVGEWLDGGRLGGRSSPVRTPVSAPRRGELPEEDVGGGGAVAEGMRAILGTRRT